MTPGQFDLFRSNQERAAGKPAPAGKKPRPQRRREELPENQVRDAIKSFLGAHGWRPYRMLAGVFRTMDMKRVVHGAPKDTPDDVFFRGPEYMFCEFKRPGGKPNPNQAICIAQMRREGMPVYVADSYIVFTRAYLARYPEEAVQIV